MAKKEGGGPPGKSGGDGGKPPIDPPVARRRQDALGRRLQQMWDEVVEEGAPDEWLSILRDIDNKGAQGGAPKGDKPGSGKGK